jgi:hypothetical protein
MAAPLAQTVLAGAPAPARRVPPRPPAARRGPAPRLSGAAAALSERRLGESHGHAARLPVPRAEFAEIDAESSDAPGGVAEGRFGPDAILLVGFAPEETKTLRAELDAIEANFVRLVTCTKELVDGALGDALETTQDDPAAETSAFGVERMMFFSGMVGGEVMQLVDLINSLEMPPSIFACAVPNNWETPVRDLIDEIADDHKLMMEREREAQAAGETVRMDAQ